MLPLERRQKIIQIISINRSIRVMELSLEFGVTQETIRRDLKRLEKEGVLKRTYGGAVLIKRGEEDAPHCIRVIDNSGGKKRIGRIVSRLVEDGDIIMLGTGTTNLECARKISKCKDVLVITNSALVISEILRNNQMKVICIGGKLDRKTLSFTGPSAVKTIKSYYVNKVIISCKGIDMEKGIMESGDMETDIKRAMIKSGQTVILVVDHSKFNQLTLSFLFDFSEIDIVVTDKEPPKEWMDFFAEKDIECLFQ